MRPWHDPRIRFAASLAVDRKTINDALTMGFSHVTGSSVFPDMFEFYWQPPAPVYDPAQARQLLAAAGYPNGFDAGPCYCDSSYANIGEAVVNNLGELGIRAKLRPIERAGFIKGFIDALFPQQAVELDHGRREAILHKMQQMVHERAIFAPIRRLAFINGVGPRVAESEFGRIPGFPDTAPYEELALTGS